MPKITLIVFDIAGTKKGWDSCHPSTETNALANHDAYQLPWHVDLLDDLLPGSGGFDFLVG